MVLGLLIVHPFQVSASSFNFSVTPEQSEKQIDHEKSYFDLKLAPNEETEVKVNLRNDTEKEVKVGISVNPATTNSNVIVEYGKNNIKKDKSLEYDINDYIQYPKSVILKPKSQQEVPFKLKMPNKEFNGVMANGITFKEETTKQEKEEDKKGLSIKNDYSYIVALLMRQNETAVTPHLTLHDVKPDQLNARNTILADIQNDQKTYINQVAIMAKITKKDDDKVLYKAEKVHLQIAPNSSFSFPVSLNGEPLKPGEYHLSMTVLGNEDKAGKFTKEINKEKVSFSNQWQFDKDFKIDGETAKRLNAKDVTLKHDNTWIYILIGAIILLLVVSLIIWFVWRKKKNEKNKEDGESKQKI